ncbi:MAG TPA: AMIN domain-containing protein, partial [Candidatus Binatia bacterium]|nr:AMIN domain-containing protein [Candidatus Binatia bacterium]
MEKFVEIVQSGRTRRSYFSLVLLAILLLVGFQATGTAKEKPKLRVGAPKPGSGRTLKVRNISVTQGPQGIDLEIQANGPLSPQTMIVENPERLVIDLPGSLPVRARKIDVNAPDVKSVRMARYRDYPPTTRVVVDLLATRDYQVLAEGNTVRVRLRDPVLASIPTSTPTLAPVRAASQPATEIATQPASTAASAEPNPETGSTSDVATQPLTDSVAVPATMPETHASSPPGWTAKPQVEPTPPPHQPVTVASTPSSGDTPAPPTGAALAVVATERKPILRVSALPEHSVKLDGVLSEPVWGAADAITNLVTIEPEQGGISAGQTIVKVLGNSHEIIIGVVCHDPDPAKIVSFSKARDAELENEDHITIVLDTFLDGRTGYVFAVNPSGARFDGLVSPQGGEVNSDWDAVWEASTSRDNGGWSAEIKIPIHSLRFKRGLSSWGLNVERRVERLQETSRWSGLKRDYEISQTSQAGLLTDLPRFDLGLGLSIRPAFTPRSEKTAGQKTRFTSDVSLDMTKTLGS